MAKEHIDFSVKAENFELLKEKLYKSIKESEETEFDPLFKVGNIVTIGTTEDDDLNDLLDELGNPEIVITSIEDDYFWGETLEGQDIEYHMEYRDISSIRPGEEKISVKVTSVDWDTDEEEDLKNLPQEFELEINHYPSNELDDEVSDAISDKYGFTHLGFNYLVESLNEETPKNTENQMIIEFSIENPNHYEDIKLYYELIIIREKDSTYSWKETSNLEEGHGFKTAVEAYENAVEYSEYPLKDLEDFEIEKTAKDVAEYFGETLNETLLDDIENIENFYAFDLKDPESLDNIWTLLEWTDNMDSEDGKTLCKYTKIGLIDTINDEIKLQADDFEPEQLERTATNKEILYYLEYLPTEAKLVSISNYDINNLYDEPHLPKGE